MPSWSRRDFLGLGALALTGACTIQPESGPTPRAPAMPTVGHGSVRQADDLCATYAINTKTFYASSVYGYSDAVIDLLDELGVRTVRERVTTGSSPGARNQRYAMPRLAERGIRWHATVADLGDWPRAEAATREALEQFTDHYLPLLGGDLSGLVHSFGGCNEVEGPAKTGQPDPLWAPHAQLMQSELWRQFKADPRTTGIPIVGPSTRSDVTAELAAELGDLSAVSDWGNAHLYSAGGSPSRRIDSHLNVLRRCFPDATSWFFTETGYSDSPQSNAGRTIPEEAAATYAIRGICDFFLRGCMYGRFELLDDPDHIDYTSQVTVDATADPQAHFGLVAMPAASIQTATPDTWRRKPEFYATQRFLRLLSDPGPTWNPEPFHLRVTGGGRDLQRILVQKRDGRHYLLLWRDVHVSTTYPDARQIDVASAKLTVRMPTERPTAIYSPRHSEAPIQTQAARGRFVVDVGADLVIVEIG